MWVFSSAEFFGLQTIRRLLPWRLEGPTAAFNAAISCPLIIIKRAGHDSPRRRDTRNPSESDIAPPQPLI